MEDGKKNTELQKKREEHLVSSEKCAAVLKMRK